MKRITVSQADDKTIVRKDFNEILDMPRPNPTILIIDDNVEVSTILALNLIDRGFNVLEAKDGIIGCDLALGKLPALILCDERMPNRDGLQTLLWLKSTPQTAEIPVFMIGGTGLSSEETWKTHGASGFVSKPFRMEELLATVEKAFLST